MHDKSSGPELTTADRSIHILPSSATMVGVCMTVLSLGRLADDKVFLLEHLVATASVAFLTSAICAYVSIRNGRGSRRAELIAEGCFLGGLVLLTVAGFFIAIELPG